MIKTKMNKSFLKTLTAKCFPDANVSEDGQPERASKHGYQQHNSRYSSAQHPETPVSAPEKKHRSECRRRNRVCVEVSLNDLE